MAAVSDELPSVEAPWVFGPYQYGWTGLKPIPDQALWVGQWLAWGTPGLLVKPPYLYLTVPGFIGGVYYPGQVFNLTTRLNRMITPEQTPSQMRAWIQEGHLYLMELMHAFQVYSASEMPPKMFLFPTEIDPWQ